MLHSLYLRNFRKHESVELSLSAGLNGIFGNNYKGKSALLLAIAVALGAPGWARGRRLPRRGQDQFEIQLTFEAADQLYRVVRTKSSGKLFQLKDTSEKLLATGHTQVNIELSRVIGMPVERWLELRFVQQKAAAKLFEAGAAKLNLLVEELTGIRTISQVIDVLGSDQKAHEARAEALREHVLPENTHVALVDSLHEAEKDLKEQTRLQATSEAELTALRAALAQASERVTSLQDGQKQANQLLRKKQEHQRDLQRAEEDLAAIPESTGKTEAEWLGISAGLEHAQQDAQALLDQQVKLAHAATSRGEENCRAQADKLFAQEEVDKHGPVSNQGQKRLEALVDEIVVLESQLRQNSSKAGEAKARLKSAQQAQKEGVCQSCNRAFDEDPEHAQALVEQEAAATQELRQLAEAEQGIQDRKDAALKERSTLQTQRQAYEQAADKLLTASDRADKALQAAQAADDALKAFEKTLPKGGVQQLRFTIQETPAKLREARDNAKDESRREADRLKARQRYDEATAALNQPQFLLVDAAKMEAMEAELQTARTTERAAEVKHNLTVSENSQRQRRIDDLTRGVKQMSEELRRDTRMMEELAGCNDKATAIASLRKHLRSNLSRYQQNAWDLILARASDWARNVTDGTITELRRTQEGAFEFVEDGEVAVVSDASGAQEAILGLAIHVGMAEAMPTHLDVFLADEPTADMDAEHSSTCLLHLSALSKQAVVISHHRMDESLCAEVMEL